MSSKVSSKKKGEMGIWEWWAAYVAPRIVKEIMRCGKRLAAPLHDIIGQMPEQHDKSSDKDTAKG